MGRPENFSEWVVLGVDFLNRAAAAAGRQLPGWTRISVAVEENGHRKPEVWSSDDFEPVFQSVLERTTRSWVNLQVDMIRDGVLELVVVYISRQDQSAISVPAHLVSVNLSGPLRRWWETLPLAAD